MSLSMRKHSTWQCTESPAHPSIKAAMEMEPAELLMPPREDTPELLNQDAYANWIVKVELSDTSELDKLMDSAAYEAFCNK